jgi:hypothetical protein
MHTWWNRSGNTPAAGIHKVLIAEARNFPDLAQFYSDEVIPRSCSRPISTWCCAACRCAPCKPLQGWQPKLQGCLHVCRWPRR